MPWTTPETFTAGQTLTAASMNAISENTRTLGLYANRIGYVERTSSYSVSATSAATAADVFSSSITWTANGTAAYLVEFFCPRSDTGSGGFITFSVVNASGTELSRLCFVGGGSGVSYDSPLGRWYYTPSAGSTTINVRAWYGVAAGTLYGSTGGSNQPPIYLALYGAA